MGSDDSQQEECEISIREMMQKYLVRPFQMLGSPICLLMSTYAAFVYGKSPQKSSSNNSNYPSTGILYANLESIIIEYQEIRGWAPVVASLQFLALLTGIFLAAAINIHNNKYYFRKFQANNHRPVPEARLPPMMIGGIVFTAGLFIFACKEASPFMHEVEGDFAKSS